MTGVEIDFVVEDSLAALKLYEQIFEVQRIEVTEFPKGKNEAVFTIYGVRFHMMDENPEYKMIAPDPESIRSVWFNITVPDIETVHKVAIGAGCREIQSVIDMPEQGLSNSVFKDPNGYLWILRQVHREVSFEERVQLWEHK